MAEEKHTLGELLGFQEHLARPLKIALTPLASGWSLGGGPVATLLRDSAIGQVLEQLQAALATPLPVVLAEAWSSYADCREYCDTRAHPPEEVNTVELAEHAVNWSCEPVIEVAVDDPVARVVTGGRLGAELRFKVDVRATIKGGFLVIQDARFRRLESGVVDLLGRVSLGGNELASHEQKVVLPGSLPFGAGIPIVLQAAAATPA